MQIRRKIEEIIYPSSSAHPTLFRLSENDQRHYTIPKLYFYTQGPASSQALKSSLSKLLTFYYPMAGRLVQRTQETAYTCPELEAWEGTCKKTIEESDDTCGMGGACKVSIEGRMDVSCLDQGALFCEAWAEENMEAFRPDFQSTLTLPFLSLQGTMISSSVFR